VINRKEVREAVCGGRKINDFFGGMKI